MTISKGRLAILSLAFAGSAILNATFVSTNLINLQVGQTSTFIVTTGCTSVVNASPVGQGSTFFSVTPLTPISSTTYPFGVQGLAQGSGTIQVNITGVPGCINPPPPSHTITVNVTGGTTPSTFPSTFYRNYLSGAPEHPVSSNTGEYFGHDETADLRIPGPINVLFRRYFATFLRGNGINSGLGNNWMHNFDVSLTLSATEATVRLFKGDTVRFTRAGNVFTLTGRERRPYQLLASGNDFRFYSPVSTLIYTFNSTGALIRIEDRTGNALTVTPSANGPTQVSDGLGRTLTFTYNGARLTRVADSAGRAVNFEYTGELLSNFIDANGKRTIFSYTAVGNFTGLMTGERRAAGNTPFTQEYDAQGRVSRQIDSRGNAVTFTYNVTPGVTAIAHGNLVNFSHAHDANSNMTRLTDANGQSVTYTYDNNDRPLTRTDRLGNRTSITYDSASGLPATFTDEDNNVTTFTYIAQTQDGFTCHVLSSVRYPDGTTISLTHDDKGRPLSLTDQSGRRWQVTRNARGQVGTLTTPTGGVTTFTYEQDGTPGSARSDAGDTTMLAHDGAKRPTTVTHPDTTVRRYQYDAVGNLQRATDERNSANVVTFDDSNRITRLQDALGNSATVAYDNDDRPLTLTDANGRATQRVYDNVGRLQSETNGAGDRETFTYDSLNRVVSQVDGAARGHSFTWDRENRMLSAADVPAGPTTRFTRDRRGLLTRYTTANNENYDFTYDSLARLTSHRNPLGEMIQYRYDSRGMLAGATHSGGLALSLERNELGLITRATDPNQNVWQRAFDKMGRLTSSTDPLNRVTTYEYDSRQRLVRSDLPASDVRFTYDAAGNLTRQLYSDSTDLSYSYDVNGRLLTAGGLTLAYDRNGLISNSNGLVIERDGANRISAITYAPGRTVRYTYDATGLVTRVTDWVGGFTEMEYNNFEELLSIRYPNAFRREFTYDANGRIATIRFQRLQAAGEITIRRDADGKTISADRTARYIPDPAAGALTLAYDAAHQSFASTSDALGRVTADGPRTYDWDLASRLKSYAGPDGTASFTYDGLGQRISRSAGGVTRNYVLNYALPLPSVAVERDGTNDLRYYVWHPDGRLLYSVEGASNARRFYHFDETGSALLITDDAGAVIDSYAITPYGETVQRTGTIDNPFTFQGEHGVMQEGATGLYYMRARWYDSASARFLSKDPVPLLSPRTMSPYQYALSDPMRYLDPAGLSSNREAPSITLDRTTDITDVYAFAPRNPSSSAITLLGYPSDVDSPNFISRSPDPVGTPSLGSNRLSSLVYDAINRIDYSLPIPRFADTSSARNLSSISLPRTNLLFPFVTNRAGFDTGLAIANTSSDIFGTPVQSGACRLNYFGSTPSSSPAPEPAASRDVYTVLSSAAAPNFQGYIIAQCQFQYAHGFAFISDLGARNLAQGYLALVLDDSLGGRSPGESLGH